MILHLGSPLKEFLGRSHSVQKNIIINVYLNSFVFGRRKKSLKQLTASILKEEKERKKHTKGSKKEREKKRVVIFLIRYKTYVAFSG